MNAAASAKHNVLRQWCIPLHHALKVEELHMSGERLHFRRIAGSGPEVCPCPRLCSYLAASVVYLRWQEGWVSVRISGKELLRRKARQSHLGSSLG